MCGGDGGTGWDGEEFVNRLLEREVATLDGPGVKGNLVICHR